MLNLYPCTTLGGGLSELIAKGSVASVVDALSTRHVHDSLVMRLIVLVPLETGMHTVEESRFSRSELVLPTVSPGIEKTFVEVEKLFVFVQVFGSLFSVHSFGCEIGKGRRVGGFLNVGGALGPRDKGGRRDETTVGELRG
jgi:hypothetical protein